MDACAFFAQAFSFCRLSPKLRHSSRLAVRCRRVAQTSNARIIKRVDTRVKLQSRRGEILSIAERCGARNVRVFGSAARGEARPDSDVDILLDMGPGRSLFDLGGLLYDLQTLLGVDVDAVTEKGLRPRIRAQVMQEAVPL